MAASEAMHRRSFLQRTLLGAAAVGLPRSLLAQAPSIPDAREIAPNLMLTPGDANGLSMITRDGVVLVDAPQSSGNAADGHGPVRALFNTNWRPEHTAANDTLGPAGVRIIAHENTKLWMSNDFTVAWEGRHYVPRPAAVLPNDTFYTAGQIEVGGEPIEFGHLTQAHTDGDLYVFFPRANVLAVSDLLAVGSYPIVDYATGGWIGGFISASERILALADDATLIVPAVGAPQKRTAVEAQLELCHAARNAVGDAYAQAQSLDELLAASPLAAYVAERGDPSLFLELAYKGAWGHIRDLGISVV
jgi:cyclase